MRAEIITVGTELLSPFFQDANYSYLSSKLEEIGISVHYKTIVGDDKESLLNAARTALSRSDLVLATGGLGPTEDDRTAEIFCLALGQKLVFSPAIKQKIERRFKQRRMPMPASNLKQCFIIRGARIMENQNGTAPGQWVQKGNTIVVLLPGPPRELMPMFESQVMPRLKKLYPGGFALRRELKLTGAGESAVEDKIKDVYPLMPENVNLTMLSTPADISIILTVKGKGRTTAANRQLNLVEKMILAKIGDLIYSRRGEKLEEVVGRLLTSSRLTLACAESCTGGLLSHRLTNIPGSSKYFLASVVAYSNDFKTSFLEISKPMIKRVGAVSPMVASAMARRICNISGSDIGLGITGIAGPGGGSVKKPVGLVYIALAGKSETKVEKNVFLGDRETIKFQATQKALDMIRKYIIRYHKKTTGCLPKKKEIR